MNVLCVTVTDAGRSFAARLPFEHVHGEAARTVRQRWHDVDAFVLFLAVGAAVRIAAPLLHDKRDDPAVVCIDDVGRFAVPVCGGHAGGANDLARHVAELLGAQPVVTTATDAVGLPALDTLPGFVVAGDVAAVTRAALDGRRPRVVAEVPWPLPPSLTAGDGPEQVVVTDHVRAPEPGVAVLHPPTLVVGVGSASDAPADRVRDLVERAFADASLAWGSVATVATIDRRATHPAIASLGRPVRAYTAAELSHVEVPTPSEAVAAAVGTPSVAEAAALLAGGPDAHLVVSKRANDVATVAVARRAAPMGRVAVVGLGPGGPWHRTPAADRVVRDAEVVIGYGPYVDQAASLLAPHHTVLRSPIGEERERAKRAVVEAAEGRRVAVVCSGDPGVYAMASLVCELAGDEAPHVEVEVVPGVTAALASAALLGAPLGHDHAVVSLSDLLTPWSVIERRVRAAAEGDFVTVFYNPRSQGRGWQLDAVLDILRGARDGATPVGIVTAAARPEQHVVVTTLAEIDTAGIGMTSCVVVGARSTRLVAGRMVTPRGYRT